MQLEQRIDFMALISVCNANPNGDPARFGRPRIDSDGFGVISPVCIKRKLRDRLSEMGEDIFVTPPVHGGDVLSRRAATLDPGSGYAKRACDRWYDVRAFGQIFAFPGIHSPGVKGAVTVQPVYSADPVKLSEMKITRCIRSNSGDRGNPMGVLSFVKYGLYVLKGSVNAYSAAKTGFSEEDAAKLRTALIHLFDNDCSAARPAGSMEVRRLYWWEHTSKSGNYSPARVFDCVKITLKCSEPRCFDDYIISYEPLDGLSAAIYEN